MADEEKTQQQSKGDSRAVARDEDLQPTWTDKDGNVHRKRILTGDRTTGKLHLGHYVGSLKNRVRLQREYDTFVLMADVQALTTHWENPKILKESVREVALDYLAVGIDPYTGGVDDGTKTKIVIQSAVPAIAELTCLYGLFTPMSIILDNPTTNAEAMQHGMLGVGDDLEDDQFEGSGYVSPALSELYKLMTGQFPELGAVSIQQVRIAGVKIRQSNDVSAREELRKYGFDPLNPSYRPFIESKRLQRFMLEELKRQKKTSGIRQMNYGFLGYPVSQAADITFVNAHLVPVGEDQVPHIELTRDIVQRFNKQYGKRKRILVEPQALVGKGGTLKGIDGNAKMSKSLGNAIYLSDSPDEMWKKIKPAPTDPQRVRNDDPGRPEVCNIFSYHQVFSEGNEAGINEGELGVATVEEVAGNCRGAKWGCVECKQQLHKKITALTDPMRERRQYWEQHPDDMIDILKLGTQRGIEEGEKTLERVKDAMSVRYWD
ncbi:tryptophan--tRNA ligase [bacterium]|nr:tryptophan--tRNA ligase [bacterium]